MHRDWTLACEKAPNAIVEAIAIAVIEDWYAAQGLRIHVTYNSALDLTGKQKFDLKDSYGKLWEVKSDKIAVRTGNFFLEHQAIDHSQADYFLIFTAGFPYILTREAILALKSGPYRVVQGGDEYVSTGTLVPLGELINYVI